MFYQKSTCLNNNIILPLKLLKIHGSCLLQLKNMLANTIESWVNLFDENNKELLPLLKMELIFDDKKMQFYPTNEDLEELVLFVIEQVCNIMILYV